MIFMRVYVVDNGGQWTHREWRVLKYLGVETKIIPNNTPPKDLDVDALVLSGGSPHVSVESHKMGLNSEYIDSLNIPVLGICAGFQFMCNHLGADLRPAEIPEFGQATLVIDKDNELFFNLPRSFTVWESHNDEVTNIPKEIDILAHTENCAVEAIKVKDKPLYGVQFHPEVENTEHGSDIFKNFISIVEAWHS